MKSFFGSEMVECQIAGPFFVHSFVGSEIVENQIALLVSEHSEGHHCATMVTNNTRQASGTYTSTPIYLNIL
jgi:hypothetical protein